MVIYRSFSPILAQRKPLWGRGRGAESPEGAILPRPAAGRTRSFSARRSPLAHRRRIYTPHLFPPPPHPSPPSLPILHHKYLRAKQKRMWRPPESAPKIPGTTPTWSKYPGNDLVDLGNGPKNPGDNPNRAQVSLNGPIGPGNGPKDPVNYLKNFGVL